jgi:hypothetical protein
MAKWGLKNAWRPISSHHPRQPQMAMASTATDSSIRAGAVEAAVDEAEDEYRFSFHILQMVLIVYKL